MRIRRSAVLFVAGVLPWAMPSRSGTVSREPAGVFDLTKLQSAGVGPRVVVQRFHANDQGLYFYLTPGPNMANGFILETDLKGNVRRTIALPPGIEVHDFDADASGQLVVLALDGGSKVLSYDSNGRLADTFSPDQNTDGVCRLGSATLGLSSANGSSAVLGFSNWPHGQMPVGLRDARRHPIMLCDPAGKVVLVERTTAVIHMVSPAGGDVVLSPRAPEMNWTPSPARNVVFSSAALCPEGGTYVTLGHFNLAEGAVVLHVDANGSVVETIRLALPRFESLKESENPGGFMLAHQIGVAGPLLFLESGDGKVAYYQR